MNPPEALREWVGNHPVAARWTKRVALLSLTFAGVIAALWLLVLWVGIIDAIIYTILFSVGVALLPFLIALAGELLPFNGAIGRLHVLLGAIAFNHHYLVDMGDRWEWCAGDKERVRIDGTWYAIDGGFENRSVLGWRPFGILRFKDDSTLREVRADTAAERDRGVTGPGVAAADGGAESMARGGYGLESAPAVTGTDGVWLVDLKRLFARGVKKIGDTELVETAEEVIERGEVTQSAFEGWQPIIGAIIGLVFGVVVGYITFMG